MLVGFATVVAAVFLLAGCGIITSDETQDNFGEPSGEASATPGPIEVPKVDPDDVTTALDLQTVDATLSGGIATFSIQTWDDWDEKSFRSSDNEMWIYINTRPQGEFNRYLYVTYDRKLQCELHHWEGELIRTVPATRSSDSSVSCQVPERLLKNVATYLRWSASTEAVASGGERSKDLAPDEGFGYYGDPPQTS